jgi:chemotaxis regulatin CheY-phosphate phosphatase CheZ
MLNSRGEQESVTHKARTLHSEIESRMADLVIFTGTANSKLSSGIFMTNERSDILDSVAKRMMDINKLIGNYHKLLNELSEAERKKMPEVKLLTY